MACHVACGKRSTLTRGRGHSKANSGIGMRAFRQRIHRVLSTRTTGIEAKATCGVKASLDPPVFSESPGMPESVQVKERF